VELVVDMNDLRSFLKFFLCNVHDNVITCITSYDTASFLSDFGYHAMPPDEYYHRVLLHTHKHHPYTHTFDDNNQQQQQTTHQYSYIATESIDAIAANAASALPATRAAEETPIVGS